MPKGIPKQKPGANTESIKKALAPLELPRVDKNNPQEIAQRLRDYFEWAIENDVRPTLIGMGTWLGVNRQTLYDWRQGKYLGNPDSAQVIQNAVNCLEAIWADQMLDGDLPPAAGIFIGINHFGYKQQVETVVKTESPLGDMEDRKQLAARVGLEIPDET